MIARIFLVLSLLPLGFLIVIRAAPSNACCPAGPAGKLVVNADQTVIMIWDAERQMQHFIRQASFRSDADDIGFLVPTPNVPELEESGNSAFPMLAKLTAPIVKRIARPSEGMSCGCSEKSAPMMTKSDANAVEVLSEKRVAGFDAQVLAATSAEALVEWLNDHGYSFSPEVRAWAEPYVRDGWKITALKVAKSDDQREQAKFDSSALRISFQTDRPLFPYREPDPTESAAGLNARLRLLRIFFVANARYQGDLTVEQPWTGTVAWSGQLKAEDRVKLLDELKLPRATGPEKFWLTEFEDYWPYKPAPADLYFSRDDNQDDVRRPDVIEYVRTQRRGETSLVLLALASAGPCLWNHWRRRM